MKRGLSPAFIDLFALMVVLFLLLPHRPETAAEADAYTGDLVAEVSWPDCQASDVDLWIRAPGDRPVGYSRLRGNHFSLFRDDLGFDVACPRMELAASRSIPDGEYVLNLHLYTDVSGSAPFEVDVHVWYRLAGGARHSIYRDRVTLERAGQEVTVVRWTMEAGEFVPGSIHHSPVRLRSGPQTIGGL